MYFNSCILKEPLDTLDLKYITGCVGPENQSHSVYLWNEKRDDLLTEKQWPLGAVSSLGDGLVWPFIFISSNGSYEEKVPAYSDRYFLCGVVAVYERTRGRLIEYPEITSGYRVLEDLAGFLPSTSISRPHISVAVKFQFYLKSALPFGSPVSTSVDLIEQFHTVSCSATDVALSQTGSQFSSQRIPSWKPFPAPVSLGPNATPSHLRIEILEKVSFQIQASGSVTSSIHGTVNCDCDIPGTPEVILPLTYGEAAPVITTHACAKLSVAESDSAAKLSFIPLSSAFAVCNYHYHRWMGEEFPISAKFLLFQISPTRFKFQLNLKLSIGFNFFALTFQVLRSGPKISALSHLDHSGKTKVELVNADRILWTIKNPTSVSADGESLEGIAEIESLESSQAGEIAGHAKIQFLLANKNLSAIAVPRNLVSIFPAPLKNTTTVKCETVSSLVCAVTNSNSKLRPEEVDFSDSVVVST